MSDKQLDHDGDEIRHPHKGIYLLPNLFTTGALFGGFYAIVAGMKGQYENAAIAMFIAMIMDALDGRVARMTNTQSAFGAEFDSLSDMVCFGVGPALVIYNWALSHIGKIGWLAAFVYAVATALRLARFNTQLNNPDKKFFIGIPCPAAAAVPAGLVWIGTEYALPSRNMSFGIAIMMVCLGLLMVSNIRYYSFKEIDFTGKVPFVAVLMVVLIYTLVAWDPPTVLFAVFVGYVLSGPIYWLWQRRKKSKLSPPQFSN
ncbi:MAG: CDP-diacylglycerol--serine O-phosphatidyltransferase [Francisellaceae bacterium]|nr:CDP-diacylglycerol--serine O-phosphatidyltransferase [Francisellaceae bacterium]